MKVMVLIPPSKFTKNVARDLVYGCWCKGRRIAGISFPPLSLLSVATVLKNEGFNVDLIDAAAMEMTIDDVKTKSLDYNAAIMLTSTMTLNEDAEILNELKAANRELISIVFGGHVTAEPESTLKRRGIDIVARREGEYIIRDLIRAIEKGNALWKNVRGISFWEDGKCIHNPDYPLIKDLDELPIPDRTMLPKNVDYFNPVVKRMPYTTMFTSRGCPGKCTFCASPTFYGKSLRFRSAESLLKELEIVQALGYKEVFFRDEIFTASKKRLMEVCQGIIDRKIDITWVCSARIDSVDLEVMEMMRKAGCHMLRLGVETGVQRLLDNIKKGITIEQTRQAFEWAHQVGLDTHAHMMIGIPGETKETLEKTIDFVKEIDLTIITFGILTVYPDTPLFYQIKTDYPELEDGTESDISRLHTKSFYNEYFTDLTSEELSEYIRKAYRKFYMRPGYILKVAKKSKKFRRTQAGNTCRHSSLSFFIRKGLGNLAINDFKGHQ